ncbi:uncharacterized protein ACR2FA_006242 isoform 1-T2 [Aphomia sociella]
MGFGIVVPYVTTFCCCFSLEVGAKAIGFLHMAVSFFMTTYSAVVTAGIHDNIGTVMDSGDHVYTTMYPIALTITVLSVAHILLAAMLVVAAFKRWCNGLRLWAFIMLVLWIMGLLYVVVITALSGFSNSGSDIFFTFSLGVVYFVLVAYCIITVNSYYLKLKSTEDMEGPAKTFY